MHNDEDSEKSNKIHNSWGLVYDLDNKLPNFYLTDEKGTFWLSKKGLLYQNSEARFVDHIFNHKLFKIKQKKYPSEPDITITIEPSQLDVDILVNGNILHEIIEIKSGRCKITSESYGLRLAFEAFFDVSDRADLACIGPRYRYINFLGKGGFAHVYKGFDVNRERFCAIKTARYNTIDPECHREKMIIPVLEHVNVIKVLAYKKVGLEKFLVTEYIAGGSMDYRIKNGKEFSEYFAKRIFKQLFSAFAYMHEKKLLHRDVKPANIVFTSINDDICIPKVIDFGLACYVTDTAEMKYIVGSIDYMSPEIVSKKLQRHHHTYTDKVDVWGLGVCLFVALTKRKPFAYNSDLEKYRSQMEKGSINYEGLVSYQNITASTKSILDQCLHIDYKKRPTAAQLLNQPWKFVRKPSTGESIFSYRKYV